MEEQTRRDQHGETPRNTGGEQQTEHQDDIFSTVVRAGKRTYFFDVKSTRSNELYLTITESKKRFNQQSGRFFYEKHKLFLYQEDFDKFRDALKESFAAVDSLQGEVIREQTPGEEKHGADHKNLPDQDAPADDE